MNPVVAGLLHLGGGSVGLVVVFKIALVAGAMAIFWKLRHNWLTVPACWAMVGAYVWLGVVWISWVQTINGTFECQLSSAVP